MLILHTIDMQVGYVDFSFNPHRDNPHHSFSDHQQFPVLQQYQQHVHVSTSIRVNFQVRITLSVELILIHLPNTTDVPTRDPWWLFSIFTLFHIIRTSYKFPVLHLIKRSPRFGILLVAIFLSMAFTFMDILSIIIPSLSVVDGYATMVTFFHFSMLTLVQHQSVLEAGSRLQVSDRQHHPRRL